MPSPSLFSARFEDVAMPMMEDQFGFTVIFKVSTRESEPFTALATDREYEAVELETGMQVKVISRDWILPADSLVVSGSPSLVVPRAGHRIVNGDDEYEIVPVPGKPAVEKHEYRYLCHSQRVTT